MNVKNHYRKDNVSPICFYAGHTDNENLDDEEECDDVDLDDDLDSNTHILDNVSEDDEEVIGVRLHQMNGILDKSEGGSPKKMTRELKFKKVRELLFKKVRVREL